MAPITILLADDHPRVRAQVRARLSHEPVFAIIGEAENSGQAVECALAARPQVVLIDPMMSDGLGLDATRQIAARLPDTAVVVLTAFADTAQRIELRKAGTRCILDKGIESRKLVAILMEFGKSEEESNTTPGAAL